MSRIRGIVVPFVLVAAVLFAASASAQNFPAANDPNPASASLLTFYRIIQRNITEAAEKMPADQYSYQPTKDVRTFGQIVAHIADAQFIFCSAARNEPNPNGVNLQPGDVSDTIEKSKSSKAELTAALKQMFEYCEPAFAGRQDAQLGETIRFARSDRPRSVPLVLSIAHLWEHYGNLTTYLRERNIVPPSTERNQRQQPRRP